MKFRGKPDVEELDQLHRIAVQAVRPHEFMLAPAFVFLKTNRKFVPIKAPLDFFGEAELERMKSYEYFYFSSFILSALPFARAGRAARGILKEAQGESETGKSDHAFLLPTSYEVSDAVLRVAGPIWWEYPKKVNGIDPYFLTLFVNSLCDLIPSSLLLKAREIHVDGMEIALLQSSLAVLLALISGYSHLGFLNQLRNRVFRESMLNPAGTKIWSEGAEDEPRGEIDELIHLAYLSAMGKFSKPINNDFFMNRGERVSLKIKDRLERISREFLSRGIPPSIFGKKGFADV